MATFNWGALIATVQKMADDWKANKPIPASAPPSGADLLAEARQLQTLLPAIIAWAGQNPGEIRAIDDLLDYLNTLGFAWADPAERASNAIPGVAAEAQAYFPAIIWALQAFQPNENVDISRAPKPRGTV